MLWSLLKILIFVAVVAGLAWLAGWLAEADGGLRVAFAGYELNLGPLQAAIGLVLLLLALWILLKVVGLLVAFIRFLNGDETALSRHFDRSRERRGFEALGDAMMALASGEGREAMSKARKADRYLDRPELTGLLTAQAAEMAGDRRRAEDAYKALITNDRTRFVGIRGVMKQRLADGDTETAMALAKRAFALRPRHEEVQDTLLTLQTRQGDWSAARETLEAKLKHGTMPRDVYRRRDAVLALSEAGDVIAEDSSVEAREAAIEANRLSPDLVPAAVMAARAYLAQGKPKYASRVLRAAWEARPHPDLAAAFAAIEPNETPQARLKRFEVLTKQNPEAEETRMLRAELLIAAEDFPGARRAMGDLAETHPTARAATLMAAIEKGEGADDAIVRAWLARAVTAPRGPQWVCDNCHTVHGDWRPVCENCAAFDTLEWTEPPAAATEGPAAGMLPMIVGAPEGLPPAEAGEADVLLEPVEEGPDAPPRRQGPAAPGGAGSGRLDTGGPPDETAPVGAPPPVEPANPAPHTHASRP